MTGITTGTAIALAGGLGAAGAVGSSIIGSNAAQSAAKTQAAAADQASAAQLAMYNSIQQNEQPFLNLGTSALPALQFGLGLGGSPAAGQSGAAGSLIAPFSPTMAQLSQTPGYQFALQQGLEATQNSFAGKGLGSSGAALKGAADYATGLASTTYQQQFQDYWINNQNALSALQNTTGMGQNAAAQLGGFGQNAVTASNAALTSGAAASAAGTVGSANAINAGISGITSTANNTAGLYTLSNYLGSNSLNNATSTGTGAVNSNIFAPSYGYGGVTPTP